MGMMGSFSQTTHTEAPGRIGLVPFFFFVNRSQNQGASSQSSQTSQSVYQVRELGPNSSLKSQVITLYYKIIIFPKIPNIPGTMTRMT